MPGIYGLAGDIEVKNGIENMQKSMFLYEHYLQDETFLEKQFAASKVQTGNIGGEKTFENEQYAVWIEGEAYNLTKIRELFRTEIKSLAELIAKAESDGFLNACLNKLDGYFNAILYDKKLKKVKLISDRYGMRLLYWYHKDGVFAWGAEVKAILSLNEVDKELDQESYECFMDIGYLLGDKTWFKQIKLINPATIIEYDISTNSLSQGRYWKWSEIPKSCLTFDEAVDEAGKRFINAVSKRFNPNERIGVALSGGLDSRAILAAITHLNPIYNGYAFTFGVNECDDIKIAKQVSAISGWQHDIFNFNSVDWLNSRIDKVWNTDGMMDLMHMHGSEFLEEVSKNIKINLNGYCGDVLLGGGFLQDLPLNERVTAENAASFYGKYVRFADINNDFYDIDCVEPNLLMNRVRRFTNYGTVNSLPFLDQRKPFFDNDLIELIYSLPDEYRASNRLYSEMLRKFFPEYFNNIVWQKTGEPVGLLRKKSIFRRAINKFTRLLMLSFKAKSFRDYTDYSSWIRTPIVSSRLQEMLKYETSSYKTFTCDDLAKRWLEPHLENRKVNNSNKILRILTIEIYLKKLLRLKMP